VRRLALFGLCLGALCLPASAHAAFPGANGKIAFHSNRADNYFDIYTMNSDGTAQTDISNNPGQGDYLPIWSPDGQKIAFEEHLYLSDDSVHVYVMNADGTAPADLSTTKDMNDLGPVWSPDGTKIAFGSACRFETCPEQVDVMNADGSGRTLVLGGSANYSVVAWSPDGQKLLLNSDRDGNLEVYTVKVDGTGLTRLTNNPASDTARDWSPDASKISFRSDRDGNGEIYTMNADGSGQSRLTTNPANEDDPAWSPDGTKIAFDSSRDDPNPTACNPNCNYDIYTINADGTGTPTRLTNDPKKDIFPNWQPLPINYYARPKGATPMRIALVTANDQCTAPNRTHGAPLAFGSCAPVQLSSGQLTVGTGDSNAKPATMQASLRFDAIPGDVKVGATLDDIFNKDLSDYTGGLRASIPLQITDKNNTPSPGGPGAATSETLPLEFDIGCTPTADTSAGSDCALNTTLDTLVPGTVTSGMRAVWQLGQVKVYDGGADGNPATTSDNTLFAVQGVFVP
jgi:Tol biopolymer transport system component